MKVGYAIVDCLRELRIGQIDADTRERKQQLLDTFNDPDDAPVFHGIAKAMSLYTSVGITVIAQ